MSTEQPPPAAPLSPEELRQWHALKAIGEVVRSRVERDLGGEDGLSGPDFGVLDRLDLLGGVPGALPQGELARSMRWSKSRLSHHLTRMQERGLVERRGGGAGASPLVALTSAGRDALRRARPLHAAAVRRHLLDRLTPAQRRALEGAAERLAEDGSDPTQS